MEGELTFGDINLFLPALIIPLVAGIFLGMVARGAPNRCFKIGFGFGFFYYFVIVILALILSAILGSAQESGLASLPTDLKQAIIFLFTVPLPIALLTGIGATISAFVLSKYASSAQKSALASLSSIFGRKSKMPETEEPDMAQEEARQYEEEAKEETEAPEEPEEPEEEEFDVSKVIGEEQKPEQSSGLFVFPPKDKKKSIEEEKKIDTRPELPEHKTETTPLGGPEEESKTKQPPILGKRLVDMASDSEPEKPPPPPEIKEPQTKEDEDVSSVAEEVKDGLSEESKEDSGDKKSAKK